MNNYILCMLQTAHKTLQIMGEKSSSWGAFVMK